MTVFACVYVCAPHVYQVPREDSMLALRTGVIHRRNHHVDAGSRLLYKGDQYS